MRHKKFNKGRILALFLAFTMLISGFPAVALGETLSPTPITSIEWVFEVSSAEFEVMGAYLEEPSPYAEEEASYQNTYEENSTAELASEGPTAEDFTSEEMSSDDESIEEDPSEEGSSEDIDSEEIDSEEINSEEISSEEEYSSDEHSDETYSDESESDDLQDDDTLAPPSITLSNVQGVVGNVGGFHFTLPCETRFITEYGEIRIAANLQGMEFAGLVNMGEIYVSDSNLNVTLTSIIINEHVLVGIEILQSIAPFGFYDFPPGATMYFSDTLAESEDGAAWLERDGDLILFFTIQPLDAPDGVIYDLTLDNTLGALPANIADHAIFRAPSGGALSGVNATSVSLTGRDSNAQGIDICLVKLHALLTPDMEYRFEIAGTAGVPSSSSQAARLVRPGVTDGPPTINHAITSTGAGGVFSFDITLSYDTIAEHASAGSMIYRIGTNSGDTNNQDIIVTTLRITEIEVDDDTNDFGYIFNLQHYIATLPDGPLGAGGAGTTTLGTTHGVANTNLSLGVAGANRFLLVDRTQTNATRGLLLQGIDFQVGDIITIEGNLLTAGLDMRIQGQSAPNNMPDVEYLNRVGGDDQGPFRMEYTMTQTLIDGGVSGGLRILAHNSGIYSQFRLYGLTVYRPDPNAAVFVPGPQIFNSITYEFNVTGVTEPTTITFPDGQFQLRQNNPAAGILQPSSRAFTVSDNGTHLWDVPFGTPAGGGFIGWSNMGENHTITGSAAQFAFEAVIIDGVRLEPTGVHTLLSGSGQLPSAFQHASEHIFAECSCGNSRLVRLDGRSTTIDHPDFPSVNLTQLRNLVMFIQDENLDGCHVPFTWGQLGGPPLYSATNATTFRGDDATIVHTGASANNDPHVLRLSGVALTESDREAIRNAENSLLAVTHTAQMTGNRAIWVWTDLSGTVPGASGNPAQLSFLTNANHDANAVIRTATIGPAEIEVPIDLLYRPSAVPGGSGTFAEHIYILTTLASSSGHSTLEDFLLAGNLRRDLTASITHASLQFVAAPTFIRNISLNVGVNQSEMRFTWWTERSATAAENATNSVVQIVRYADLVGGEMPPSPREIMGHAPVPIDSNLPQYAYNVSRANVTGITPNTRYAYRVGNLVGGEMEWSPIHHFDSFAPNDGHTVLLVGDPQIGAWSLMRQWNKWQNSLTDAFTRVRTMYTQNGVGHGGVDFILSAGDNSTPANNMERFHIFMQPYQLRNTPMFTTIGNHDTVTQHAGDAFDRIALLSYAYYWPNHDWLRAGATLVDGVVTGGTPGRSTHESNYVRGGGNHFFV
ncbi:MAG: fibronectin type III domain-containing protein, partial [Defluviitaleaceae bacterium]|nr:fibronectin type III domain-containing protein [Defluviitaleaceae bacterium]